MDWEALDVSAKLLDVISALLNVFAGLSSGIFISLWAQINTVRDDDSKNGRRLLKNHARARHSRRSM